MTADQQLQLPGAVLARRSVSEQDNVGYLLTCTATGSQLLVDAADDAPALLDLLGEQRRLDLVVTTHRHWDHHRALAEVVAATGAPTAAGADDADELPVAPDRRLQHGDRLEVGELVLDVLHLRGHTPGSIALAWREGGPDGDGRVHLLTGDSLFPGGPGRTTSPQDFASLVDDLEQRVFGVFDDDAVVWPGHGEASTLGAERPQLASWRARGW